MSVEKYILSKDESGFTILSNTVLQNYTDIEGLGLWAYLASKPTSWVFYKEQLRKHFSIGRERLQKALKSLSDHGLITITSVRNESGQFAHANVHVHSGEHFKIIAKPLQDAASKGNVQPCTGKPSTVNQSPVNNSYKERGTKKELKKKEDQKILRSSDDEPPLFVKFYDTYPRKQKSKVALAEWIKNDCDKVAHLMQANLEHRLENEWNGKEKQHIPLPDTYIRQKRHTDELLPMSKSSQEHPVTASIRNLKEKLKSPAFHDLLS